MTREEEIDKIASAFAIDEVKDTCNPASKRGLLYVGFVTGAEWADEHPHWISVNDELPKDGIYTAIINKAGFQAVRYYKGGKWFSSYGNEYKEDITHWLPLPQPPKKGGEE